MIFSILRRNFYKFGKNEIFENILPFKSESYFDALVRNKKQTFYLGIDPTAKSLQIGNMFPLMALLRMWSDGHNIIIVVGGATGQIGDPTGRNTDRVDLPASQVSSNVTSISNAINNIVNNYHTMIDKKTEFGSYHLLNNQEWYDSQSIVTFLSTVLKHFRFSDLKNKRSVEDRLQSNSSLNMKEFFYPFLQAYDWLHLYREHGCKVQIGGDDQQGNMQLGQTLIEKVERDRVYGLTVPLFVIGGEKVGKSNPRSKFNVFLSPECQSPFSLYCTCLHVPNTLIIEGGLLRRLTAVSEEDEQRLMAQHRERPDSQTLQHALAQQLVRLVHGGPVSSLVAATQALFSPRDRASLPLALAQINNCFSSPDLLPAVPHLLVDDPVTLETVLSTAAPNNSDRSGALFNGRPVADLHTPLSTETGPIVGVLQIGSGSKWVVVRRRSVDIRES